MKQVCKGCLLPAFLATFLSVVSVDADEVQMRNGDRYLGKVVGLTADSLMVQSEVLGTVKLPRAKVAQVTFGAIAATNSFPAATNNTTQLPSLAATNAVAHPVVSPDLRQLGAQSGLIRQVQDQFLAGAGPEANAKFNELLTGLSTGKLNLNDLRAEALAASTQLRAARKDLGEDAGGMLDGYLAILEQFVKETPAAGAPTNAVSRKPTPPKPAEGD